MPGNNGYTTDRNVGRGRLAPKVTFTLSRDEHLRLTAYCEATGETLSEVVRTALFDVIGHGGSEGSSSPGA